MILFLSTSAIAAATASPPAPVSAVLGERASEFGSLAECNAAIGAADTARGSAFNRAHGNVTRCAMVDGEPMVIVTPRARPDLPRD